MGTKGPLPITKFVGYPQLNLSTSSDNHGVGYQVGHGAYVNVMDSVSENNDSNGYHSYFGGVMRADRSSAHGNGYWGALL